jgi:hypothetical protein
MFSLYGIRFPYPQAVVTLELIEGGRLPLYWRETTENVPPCVLDKRQSVRAAIAAEVEFISGETVAAAPPQQFEMLHAELFKSRRKFINNLRINLGSERRWRMCQSIGNRQPE